MKQEKLLIVRLIGTGMTHEQFTRFVDDISADIESNVDEWYDDEPDDDDTDNYETYCEVTEAAN